MKNFRLIQASTVLFVHSHYFIRLSSDSTTIRLTLRELYYDEISDDKIFSDEFSYDEISYDEISDDEISDDEISDDEFSDDEISGNRSYHGILQFLAKSCHDLG